MMQFVPAEAGDTARQEALNLYDRALSDGNPAPFHRFLEQYLAMSPPPFDLLYEIADDLQHRQIALRAYYFEVRDSVVQTFQRTYQMDITLFSPSTQLYRYHLLNVPGLLDYIQERGIFLSDGEAHILREMIETSLRTCAEVYRDIQLTHQLQEMLDDWLAAYQTVFIRQEQYWDVLEIDASLWLQ